VKGSLAHLADTKRAAVEFSFIVAKQRYVKTNHFKDLLHEGNTSNVSKRSERRYGSTMLFVYNVVSLLVSDFGCVRALFLFSFPFSHN
jgi:hypothetical protein